ncbi:MAG: methyltransferase domain-containing protein [Pseudomonadota bacterium]
MTRALSRGARRFRLAYRTLQLARRKRALDLGGGGSHLTVEIARVVAQDGHAVGIDLGADQIAVAWRPRAGMATLDFIEADAVARPFDTARLTEWRRRRCSITFPTPKRVWLRSGGS